MSYCLHKIISFKFIFLVGLLLIAGAFYLSPDTNAQSTLRNEYYMIRMGNLNSIAGESAGSGYNLNITGGQTAPGRYSGTNYVVRAGFQYISSIIPFYFKIDNIVIDFGTLSPTNPVTRTSRLTIDNQSAGGYVVTAQENHQLFVPSSGQIIPDTTCDTGNCNDTTAGLWSNTLTYGFGYRCDPVTTNYCPSDFNTADYYKQFADASKNESPVTVMSGQSGRNQQATITYKVNISSTQPAGLYTNAITYIATPTF